VLVSGALASAKAFHVPHRVLSSTGIQRHFPGLRPLDDWVGVLEDRAGVLFPEECIATLLAQATKAGAEVRADDAVLAWKADAHGVQVATSGGIYTAAQLVLSAGAWMPRLVSDLAPALAVVRQPIHWFEPTHPEQYSAAQCPVTLWEFGNGHFFYTLPDFGDGVKAGVHYEGQRVDPDHVNRQTSTEEDAQVTDLLRRFMPHAKGHLRSTQVCLYTNTPDLHFVIDMHPSHPRQVAVVSACSGHGFKFATAIGEIVKDMLAGTAPRYDLSMFRMNRFQVGT
jgi:sarcosine oxidase